MDVASTMDRAKLLMEARKAQEVAKGVGKRHVAAPGSRGGLAAPWGTDADVTPVARGGGAGSAARAGGVPYEPEGVRPGVANLPYGTDPDRTTALADDFLTFHTPHPARGACAPERSVRAPFGVDGGEAPSVPGRGPRTATPLPPPPFAVESTPLNPTSGAAVKPPPWMVHEQAKPTGRRNVVPPEHGEFENPQVAQDYGAFLKQQMAEREYLEASEKYQQRMAERINLQTESLCAVTGAGLSSPPKDVRGKRQVAAPKRSTITGEEE